MTPFGHTNNHSQNLTISHWNANGLENKLPELKLYMCKYKIDVMCINETKFNDKVKFNVPGYNCHRQDRRNNARAGGVLILIKNNIACSVKNIVSDNVEAIGVQLECKLTIVATYLRPQNKFDGRDFDEILHLDQKVIIVGDLNSKHPSWNSGNRANSNGNLLFKYLLDKQCILLAPDQFTHHPYNANLKSSIIDIAIIKNVVNCRELEVIDELDSDHLPILLKLKSNSANMRQKSQFHDYNKADWKSIRKDIECSIDLTTKIHTVQELDSTVKTITTIIQTAIDKHIPKISTEYYGRKNNPEIGELIKERNKLKRIYQRTGDPEFNLAKNRLTNIIKIKLKADDNKNWEEKLIKLKPKDNSLWKFAKFLTKNEIQPYHIYMDQTA